MMLALILPAVILFAFISLTCNAPDELAVSVAPSMLSREVEISPPTILFALKVPVILAVSIVAVPI